MTREGVAVIIPAAGGSRRLGQPKQLVSWGGRTLVENAIDTALAIEPDRVIVVLGAHEAAVRRVLEDRPVEIVVNERWSRGLGGSIAAGAKALEKSRGELQSILVHLCDQPHVSPRTLRRLWERFREGEAPAALCGYDTAKGPPAIFTSSLLPELTSLTGDVGAKPLFKRLAPTILRAPEAGWDVDEPGDLERLSFK